MANYTCWKMDKFVRVVMRGKFVLPRNRYLFWRIHLTNMIYFYISTKSWYVVLIMKKNRSTTSPSVFILGYKDCIFVKYQWPTVKTWEQYWYKGSNSILQNVFTVINIAPSCQLLSLQMYMYYFCWPTPRNSQWGPGKSETLQQKTF